MSHNSSCVLFRNEVKLLVVCTAIKLTEFCFYVHLKRCFGFPEYLAEKFQLNPSKIPFYKLRSKPALEKNMC